MRTARFLTGLAISALIITAAATTACTRTTGTSTTKSNERDTITTRALARFRDTLKSHPGALANGAPSLDSLINAFGSAVARRDTSALRALALSPAEFAYLYYPNSPMSSKPYELDADLMWMQISSRSTKGLSRLLATRGGRPFNLVSYQCSPAQHHGRINIINGCQVLQTSAPRDTSLLQLFGEVVERSGTYKFVGYANRL
jgi:hypothetical protein